MCNGPSPRSQQFDKSRNRLIDAANQPRPAWTSFPRRDPGRDLEDGARPRCAGCGHELGGCLHVTRPERRPHPVGICAECLGVVARAVRTRDPHQLDAAAQLLTVAWHRSGVL